MVSLNFLQCIRILYFYFYAVFCTTIIQVPDQIQSVLYQTVIVFPAQNQVLECMLVLARPPLCKDWRRLLRFYLDVPFALMMRSTF